MNCCKKEKKMYVDIICDIVMMISLKKYLHHYC